MANYALIENGIVINIIVWEGPEVAPIELPPSITYVELEPGQNVGPGYLYQDGGFSAPPEPEPTHDELVIQAQIEKQQRLTSADSVFLEWQTKLLLNIASEDEKQAVISWVNYKEAVKAVDPQQAPNIQWPEPPPIPESAQ